MVKRGDDVVVLWPRYFDQRRSRAEGRRVPSNLAVKEPDAKWLESAAKKAGFRVDLEEDARDPFRPWQPSGRIVIQKTQSKEETIKAVAQAMHN